MTGLDGAIGGLLGLALLGLFWASAVTARERARAAARAFCERNDWQLLDETVALRPLRPTRAARGLEWCRIYRFEFSPDGGGRRSGELTLQGRRLMRVWGERDDGSRLIEPD
ncbi:MAG: DUF3301 domain-containing protein [Pseudomonadota bacterium]|nr:MAG: DUF3301 domain-containing protein [Pseudomonadota bacterium]